MADIQRLEQALQNAATAGDTAAAQMLAQEIRRQRSLQPPEPAPVNINPSALPEQVRSRRATGDQLSPSPVVDTEADPLAQVDPIERIQAIADPDEQRREASILSGRLAGEQAVREGDISASAPITAIRSSIPFGGGDLVAATAEFAKDPFGERSFGDFFAQAQEFGKVIRSENAGSAIAGEVFGSLVGGVAAFKVLQKVGTLGKSGNILEKLAKFDKGISRANILKTSAFGATAAGLTEAGKGESVAFGAGVGAAAGPLGPILKVAGVGTGKFVGLTFAKAVPIFDGLIKKLKLDPASRGLKAIAKQLGESNDDVFGRFVYLRSLLGRTPSVGEMLDKAGSAEIKEILESAPSAAKLADKALVETLEPRPGEVAATLRGATKPPAAGRLVTPSTGTGKFVTSEQGLSLSSSRLAKARFAKADKDIIVFSPNEAADILGDRGIKSILAKSPNARVELGDILDSAGDGVVRLRGTLANKIRAALVEARKLNPASEANDLLSRFDDVLRAGSKNFDEAIGGFEKRKLFEEGFSVGKKVRVEKSEEAFAANIDDILEGNVASSRVFAGARTGARTAISTSAGKDLGGALATITDLIGDTATIRNLKQVLPVKEVALIQAAARAEKDAIEALIRLAPGQKPSQALQNLINSAANAAVVIGPTSAASKTFSFGKVLKDILRIGKGINRRVAENIAESIFDPAKTDEVLTILRRMNTPEEDILNLFVTSFGAGQIAAQALEE